MVVDLIAYIITLAAIPLLVIKLEKPFRIAAIAVGFLASIFLIFSASWFAGAVNAAIALAHTYKFYYSLQKNYIFKVLRVQENNEFLTEFLNYYKKEIFHYSPYYIKTADSMFFLLLDHVQVIGVFVVKDKGDGILLIQLDFVVPGYRNFSVGKFLFEDNIKYFTGMGYKNLQTVCLNETHADYLNNMGFKECYIEGEKMFVKELI